MFIVCATHILVVRPYRYLLHFPYLGTGLAFQPSPFHPFMHIAYHYAIAQFNLGSCELNRPVFAPY